MIERLPEFAESHFSALCAHAGVVCNPSLQDAAGWDFFVQFPVKKKRAHRPADMEPPGPEALVQVKSTRGPPFVVRLKLSNALKATQAPQPFFLVMVVPDDASAIPRVYARHFWEPEIRRTLKRVRLAERTGDHELNRRSFSLRLSPKDDHSADLLEWMRQIISEQTGYAAKKAQIASTVGFEGGFGNADVTFEASIEDLIDWELGLKEGLPLKKFVYVPQRFGIDAPTPEIEVEGGTMYVEPVGQACRLRLQGGLPTSELVLEATLFSRMLPGLSEEHQRWRLQAGALRLSLGKGKTSAKLSLPLGEQKRLKEIDEFLRIAAWQTAGRVSLQLHLEGQKIPLGMLEMSPGNGDDNWADMSRAVAAIRRIAAFDPDPPVTLSVVEIDKAAPWLNRFVGLTEGPSLRIEYEPEGAHAPVRAIIYYVYCAVGAWSFLALVERSVSGDVMVDGRRQITFGEVRLLEGMARPSPYGDHLTEMEAEYRRQLERMGSLDTIWEIGDLERFLADQRSSKAA